MDFEKHIQSFFLSAGNNACNALCIIKNANKWRVDHGLSKWNYLEALVMGIQEGYILFCEKDFNDEGNFYVKDGSGYMSFLTKVPWRMSIENADYVCNENEMEIQFWAWSDERALKKIGHFITPGENTLQYSKSVAEGKCYSKRIYRRV